MWTCRHCGLKVMYNAVEPDVDEEGYYFFCPGCGGRNALINMAKDGDDNISWEQPDV